MTDRVNTTAPEGTIATQRGAERRARLSPELRAYAERLAETVDFRVRLRELRSTLGVTQAAAAEITGENQGDISRMESGELNPSVTRANRILQRLGEYATTLTEPAAAPIPVRRISRRPIVNADVAAAYLCAVYDDEDSFSQLKLQKLLYYAQGYALALLGRPLFGDRIEAWDHGPVVPGVWQAHTQHQARPLPRPETFDVVGVDPEARAVLDRVYAELGQFEAWRLRDMTHDEPPWRDTPHNETIPLDRLRDYFTSRLSATEGTREIRGADNVPTGGGNDKTREFDEHEAITMPKHTPKQIHVTKNPDGWGATRAGASRSSIPRQPTQAGAEHVAKDLAKRTGGAEVVTHRPDGKIRSSDTIARPDPHPPIDKEH